MVRTDVLRTSRYHKVSEPLQHIHIAIDNSKNHLVACDHISSRLLLALAPSLLNDRYDRCPVLPAASKDGGVAKRWEQNYSSIQGSCSS
jgi:hypothetical protein